MIGAGGAYVYGKKMLESPGRWRKTRSSIFRARAGNRDIAETLQREGVIDVNPLAVHRARRSR